ncbi:LOW QUALITY PROTEIN: hypothetical protein PanWU01x14_101490 [Parasponia andersonii]|uniref:Uncharacterized protein n=1 Tax=Parasponia andersonii TaxID=3476 RepID=A0A2P5D387_PARAD|nr:LOW QUALITY PROTEIN: hypothetical protein PanWU01x14_101490 [Parasponia andersonii]
MFNHFHIRRKAIPEKITVNGLNPLVFSAEATNSDPREGSQIPSRSPSIHHLPQPNVLTTSTATWLIPPPATHQIPPPSQKHTG